jgi:predicted naringenin-chalcone synthase
MQPRQPAPGYDRESAARTVLAVPATVYPDTVIDHDDLVERVLGEYRQAYERAGVGEIQTSARLTAAERKCRNLAIDYHPATLPLDRLVRPRGFGTRNAEAANAVCELAPAAARQAMANSGVAPADVDALIAVCSTMVAMPSVANVLADVLGLACNADLIPVGGMGCVGGAHAIARARDYVTAWPDRVALIVAVDIASPWFYIEDNRRGRELIDSVVGGCLFSDGAAAAVMSQRRDATGFEILDTAAITVPRTRRAIRFDAEDDGLHLSLSYKPLECIGNVTPTLQMLIDDQKWVNTDLAPCAFHTGGPKIIDLVQHGLGLHDAQVAPAREALRKGNTMSAAIYDSLEAIGTETRHRPAHGAPGLGAGFGPGFSAAGFSWRFHSPDG